MDLTISPLTSGQWPALEDLFGKGRGLERMLVHVLAGWSALPRPAA